MSVEFFMIAAGYCTHSEHMAIAGGQRKPIKLPALVGVIVHPTVGVILFDTGYGYRFQEITRRFPYIAYAKMTPVFYSVIQWLVDLRSEEPGAGPDGRPDDDLRGAPHPHPTT